MPALNEIMVELKSSYQIQCKKFPQMPLIDSFLLCCAVHNCSALLMPPPRSPEAQLCSVQATAAVQLIYCVLFGSFPYNAFLSGFISSVGTFILTGIAHVRNVATVDSHQLICT